jgi:hypothetical protein
MLPKERIMNKLMKCLPIAALLLSLLPAAAAQSGPVTLEVLNPMGVIEPPKTFGLSPRVADLAGKDCLDALQQTGRIHLLDVLQELLQKRYPAQPSSRISDQSGPAAKDPDMYKKAAAESNAFIFAMGD